MAASARWTMVGVAAALIGAMTAGRAGAASGVTEYLAGFDDHERHNAVIQLEPAGAGGDELRLELGRIDALWNEGRHEQAVAAARAIEAGGVELALVDEAGDDALYMIHSDYWDIAPTFGPRLRCNELDLAWGYDGVVERLAEGGWGVLTTGGANASIYFDQAPLLLRDGFESGSTSGWSATAP